MKTIDHRIVEIALERVQPNDFEKFVQAFYSAEMGADYVPLGGMHDGGADGWVQNGIFEIVEGAKFLQASITGDIKNKIKQTVARLRECGRAPASLLFCSSKPVGKIDLIQEELSSELNCRVVIRDATYFVGQINSSPQSVQAYDSYLAPAASFLFEAGSAQLVKESVELPARTLCVFVGQELDRRRGQTELLETVADSLIIWSLESTNPEKNSFMTRDEIEARVISAMPSANIFFRGVLDARLNNLKTKTAGGRRINFHSSQKGYCLPFETRQLIQKENIEDETLRLEVSKVFRSKSLELVGDKNGNAETTELIVEVAHAAVHKLFYRQGLELSMFLQRENEDDLELPSLETHIDEVLKERNIKGPDAAIIASAVQTILRRAFYKSSKFERQYFGKLSRTYVLMFLLKNEPRIVEYLRAMSANFVLYVGADIIVRCLSEHMLLTEDRMATNALATLKAAGSKIVLTDKALDEVWHHIQTSHFEYMNHFSEVALYMTFELAKQIRKILVRAYFYYRLDQQQSGKIPKSWDRYLSQFCDVSKIKRESSRDDLREYLLNHYKFDFETNAELENTIDADELNALSNNIFSVRNRSDRDKEAEQTLCRNAASTVLRVYSRRNEQKERGAGNPLGYKTWWLTQQTKVRNATGEIVAKKGAKYMMRPEFVLHFLSAMPSTAEVQKSFADVFPSILGIRLGNRMDERSFLKVIDKAKSVFDSNNESRAKVVLARATEELQADFIKKYDY